MEPSRHITARLLQSTSILVSICLVGVAPAAALGATQPSGQQTPSAQSEQANQTVGEIVVTAQRRSEKMQDVPLAVTAITGNSLAASGVKSTLDLGNVVPGLEVGNTVGFILPFIRGIGTTAHGPATENSVATYVDGVYIASATASLFSLSNIQQVEVLKGPQGTLFGRNATGGVIQVTTRDPWPGFQGNAEVGFANYKTVSTNFYVSGGSDAVAGDLLFSGTHSGEGYGKNLFTGQDVYKADRDMTLRSKWLMNPTDTTEIRLIGDYSYTSGSQYSTLDTAPGTVSLFAPNGHGGGKYDIDQDFQPRNQFHGGGVSLRIDQNLGAITFASVTAWRQSQFKIGFDADFAPTPIVTVPNLVDRERQFTQEFQLQSAASSPLKWVGGLYYFDGRGSYDPSEAALAPFLSPPVDDIQVFSTQKTRSLAGFGQMTFEVLPRTNLTLGARYTYEKRTFDARQIGFGARVPLGNLIPPVVNAQKVAKKPTVRVALDHRFDPQVLGYVSFNTGFKSGGFNSGVPTSPPFDPETLKAFEAGLKMDLLDRHVRVNPSIYHYDYKKIQVEQPILGQVFYYNGASATLNGIDVDVTAVLNERFSITGGLALLESKFTSFPNAVINTQLRTGGTSAAPGSAKGNLLPYAPRRTASIAGDYKVPVGDGEVSANLTYSYNSGYYVQADNILKQNAFSLVNASIAWKIGATGLSARLWGRNLTNARVASSLQPSAIASLIQLNPPRTYGVSLKAEF